MTIEHDPALRVLLLSEGTYPFLQGGVAIWCDMLVNDMPDIEFAVLSIIGDPCLRAQYHLPENVVSCEPLAIWGIREIAEMRRDIRLRDLLSRRRRSNEAAIAAAIAPLVSSLLRDVFLEGDVPRFARSLQGLYRAFQQLDFDTVMHSDALWSCFVRAAQDAYPAAAQAAGYENVPCSLADIADAHTLLTHWLMPLARRLPVADVAHAVSAGLCSMVGVVARLEYGMPLLLTEHGIYLRECYLAELNTSSGLLGKLFRTRFARMVTEASYLYADQISPGSNYNQRWELRLGAAPERIRTIYNGVDPQALLPGPDAPSDAITVVWVGRITPIKDVETLIRAAALVHQRRPDVRFRVYGTPPRDSEAYYETCVALRDRLGLAAVLEFAGFAPSAEAAFHSGDIAVLSSISEGFPFSVVEAMLCARPVVATAVGGVPEALKGCGITVEPRNPEEMAAAIVRLADDAGLRTSLGAVARERASREFTLAQCSTGYRESYQALARASAPHRASAERRLLSHTSAAFGPHPTVVLDGR